MRNRIKMNDFLRDVSRANCRLTAAFAVATAAVLSVAAASPAHAHAGHDHAPGEDDADAATTGPIAITAQARQNLGLQTVEAQSRTLDKTLAVLGQIQTIPDRTAAVSSRIAGRVVGLPVNEGQRVKRGQVVAEVESFQVGNPPPRAQYVAPLDGIVLSRDVLPGASADPNTRLLTIADLSEVYAEARVFEGQVAQVHVGQAVRVRSDARPGEVFAGTIERLGGALDPETRTLKVWARVANPDSKLLPNAQATVVIVTAEADSVTAVPRAAVLGDAGNLFVFVQAGDDGLHFERRPVVVGITDDRDVELVEGVLPGDRVVTVGNYQLQYVAAAPRLAAKDEHRDEHDRTPVPAPANASTGGGHPFLADPWRLGLGVGLALSLLVNGLLLLARRRPADHAFTPVMPVDARHGAPFPPPHEHAPVAAASSPRR